MAQRGGNPPAVQETQMWVNPRVRKIPWSWKWQSTLVVLPGEIPQTEEPGGL